MTLLVRKATVADIDCLYYIEQEDGFNPRSKEQLLKSLEHHDAYVLINVKSKTVMAFSVYQLMVDDVELLNVVVAKAYQSKGLGRYLLNMNLQHYRQSEFKQCLLEVGHKNLKALQLYLSLGFYQVGLRKNYYQLITGQQDALLLAFELSDKE